MKRPLYTAADDPFGVRNGSAALSDYSRFVCHSRPGRGSVSHYLPPIECYRIDFP